MKRNTSIRIVEELLLHLINGKMPYVKPMSQVIKVEDEAFFCTSVKGAETGNQQQQWEEEEIGEGGEDEL